MGCLLRLVGNVAALFFFVAGIGLLFQKPPQMGAAAVSFIIAALIWRVFRRPNWRNDPATDRQRDYADDLEIRYRDNISKGELSDLIDKAVRKKRRR